MRLLEELAARELVTTAAERSEPSPASPAAVRALVETIPAAGTHRHGNLVHGLVRWLKPATVVESGTWCGYLTAVIAVALAENRRGRLVSIDDWSGADVQASAFIPREEDVRKNLEVLGLGDRVELRRGSSAVISLPDRLDLAVLDSCHDATHVQIELERMRAAGCGCFLVHDVVSRAGPASAIERFLSAQEPSWSIIEAQFNAGLALLMDRQSPLLAGARP
jgi:predicted O-methyltransferase YrrM